MTSLTPTNSSSKIFPINHRIEKIKLHKSSTKHSIQNSNLSRSTSVSNYSELLSSRSNKTKKCIPSIPVSMLTPYTPITKQPNTTRSNKKIQHSFSSIFIKKKKKKSDKELPKLYQEYLNVNENLSKEDKKIKERIPKDKVPNQKLIKLYKMNDKYMINHYKIKGNNQIAYQNEFKVSDYQSMLLDFTSITARRELLLQMKHSLNNLNKIALPVNKRVQYNPKSRWDYLIQNIENNVPKFLIEKIKTIGKKKYNKKE